MTPPNTLSWYIVQFKPNSHKIAVRNLQRQGFETFLPMHEVTRRTVVKFETADSTRQCNMLVMSYE